MDKKSITILNVVLSCLVLFWKSGSASNIVYLEKGESGCISFSQAETNTDRAIKRENSVLCMQFSGSKEVGITFPAAWSRSFSCQTNDSHISVCISSATEEDGGIFFYTFGLLTIDNRTLMIESPELTIRPQTPATVREGETIVLTCQSNHSSGIYQFFTIDGQGNRVIYGTGGGSFKSCQNGTQAAFLDCNFENPWKFFLTLLNPIHNQVVYCSRAFIQGYWNTSTTIFVQVPVSSVVLKPTRITVNIDEIVTLTCQTDFCNPPANITWYKASSDITSQATSTTETKNGYLVRTTSVLPYTGVAEDNDQEVHCAASNIPEQDVESMRYKLNVRYISEVQILPVSTLNVVVGQSQVWLYCCVDNTSPVNSLTYRWVKWNSRNSSLVSSSQIYVIKTAKMEDSGTYVCTATNSFGNSSGSVDINVQLAPLAPEILHVVCRSTYADIVWISSSTDSPHITQETLQCIQRDINRFVNITYKEVNRTKSNINIYHVTDLKPNTPYIFRVLASNLHGITLSDNISCFTNPENEAKVEGTNADCNQGEIIGGIIGGLLFIIILVVISVSMLIRYRKAMNSEGNPQKPRDDSIERPQRSEYVDQLSPVEDHQYQGISNTDIQKTGVYEKLEAPSQTDTRAEYTELISTAKTEDRRDASAADDSHHKPERSI
ncbi:uncharacterized protein LOC125678831 isoform X3 [Ostrea edulis]|uniref:uncharacterized protein LOC125678831 isoform X3 n=1 Tax=Ostrea edulis TaxID=37623 RepID=UPI0024AF6C52|nr:uncharacterized protein LOC125678831 isoform X3 [Ostrea edulis]